MVSYGFADVSERLKVSDILLRIPEKQLWDTYFGPFHLNGQNNKAPYRKDNNASVHVFEGVDGRIRFKDHSRRDYYGDIFDLLRIMYGLNLSEAVQKIASDFGINSTPIFPSDLRTFVNGSSTSAVEVGKHRGKRIGIWRRKFGELDIEFWQSWGITGRTVVMYNVYCVETVHVEGQVVYTYKPEDPCYAYYFPKSGHIKCYFPKRKVKRFLGNTCNSEDIQGYYQCRVKESYEGKMLVLTKSMKDCMVLREHNIDAMAINGENHRFSKDFIRHIKKYYPRIVSLYDTDHAGITGAWYLWREYGIPAYFIPRRFRGACKDISDLHRSEGREEVSKFVQTLLV